MKITKYFLSIFITCTFFLMAILLLACTTVEVDTTTVPEISTIKDEFLTVPMEALPFYVEIPSGWTFTESGVYSIQFDLGASGGMQFNKAKMEESFDELLADGYIILPKNPDGFTVACKSIADTSYCGIKIGDSLDIYQMTIINKTLTEDRLKEIDQIIQSLKVD
ncbi:MAG: hypothetical protein WC897_05275 [Candidatus Gracilibacteria bacterium]